jgi:hypothetical protein
MSDDHISNVVLRMYARKIAPFPRPFGMDTRVPTVVWKALVQRAHEMREIIVEWNVTDKREYWNRWYE